MDSSSMRRTNKLRICLQIIYNIPWLEHFTQFKCFECVMWRLEYFKYHCLLTINGISISLLLIRFEQQRVRVEIAYEQAFQRYRALA